MSDYQLKKLMLNLQFDIFKKKHIRTWEKDPLPYWKTSTHGLDPLYEVGGNFFFFLIFL